jgi:hypothetical protein
MNVLIQRNVSGAPLGIWSSSTKYAYLNTTDLERGRAVIDQRHTDISWKEFCESLTFSGNPNIQWSFENRPEKDLFTALLNIRYENLLGAPSKSRPA